MTNQGLQELSKRVAEKFGINESELYQTDNESYPDSWLTVWLHEDLERVMRLAIEHRIPISYGVNWIGTVTHDYKDITEVVSNHDTREQAVIVAVMRALKDVEV